MKVTLIYNPGAGVNEQPTCEELLDLIRRAGHDATSLSLTQKGWQEALHQPLDVVAVAGGDGTVGVIAKQLERLRTAIAVVPMGTANNIAKTLGLAERPLDQWIAEWSSARRIKFDVGAAAGPWGIRYFVEGLGIGLFTGIMSRLDASGNIEISHLDDAEEKITSVREMLYHRLQSYPAQNLELILDGEPVNGEYILLEMMNTPLVGPNLFLAPDADPGDGFLDVVLVTKVERRKFSRYLRDSIEGSLRIPDFSVRRAREIKMEWTGFAVHVDDDVWPDKGVSFDRHSMTIAVTVNHHAVEFLAPP